MGSAMESKDRCACFVKEGWLLHETKSEIERITARLKQLSSRFERYDRIIKVEGGPSCSNARWEDSRRPYPHIVDDHVVGLDDDINKLVAILVDDQTNRCRVACIWGMGGLGKTTLAKRVYHHSKVKNQFKHLALVYVSQQWQKRKLWEHILSGLSTSPQGEERDMIHSKLSDADLAEKLFNLLKNKRCLVILDDIWSIEAWDSLKAAFPMAGTSSKILLTSRNMDIVRHADPRGGYLYELKCLKEEESWELFQKIAFSSRDNYPDYRSVDSKMEELGKATVKDCAGLPLAIIVLGGLLAKKYPLNQWQTVSENVMSVLNKDKGQVSEQVLSLSYKDLPPHLKPCFLYLSHFPEDYEIPVETLIQLWVAEGFVPSDEEGEIMEDVAESYLNELVERCLIQVGERDATLRIKTCRMHDLMRDLCLCKAKQESFVYIIDHSNSLSSSRKDHSPASISPRARRIVEHQFSPIQPIRRNSRLRSILFFCHIYAEELLNPSMLRYWERYMDSDIDDDRFFVLSLVCFLVYKAHGWLTCMLENFKLLRVFGVVADNYFVGYKLPSAIGNLIHLRFLSLRDMDFFWPKFPSTLGNLRSLQTLDLRGENISFSMRLCTIYIPNVIWRLEQLRHLYLPQYDDEEDNISHKTKLELHTLTKLQTLVNFNTKHCFIQDLCRLINLRKLEMLLVGAEEYHFEDPIIKSKHIHSLTIQCPKSEAIDGTRNYITPLILSSCLSTICELSLEASIGKLPDNFSNSNIAYLRLRWCQLEEDPMPTLEKLPNLRILILEEKAFMGTKMVCSAPNFPKLDSLTLEELENLEEWKVEQGAMPALRSLYVRDCYGLEMLPEGLKFTTTLHELTIGWMPPSFKSKLERGGQDFYKVQHVPSIRFFPTTDSLDP